jgi:hypothetical protein
MYLQVAVTIDVEPPVAEAETLRLLEKLDEYGVHVTFFVTGRVIERHRQLMSVLLSADHELALHGYMHHLWQGKRVERKEDVLKGIKVFRQIIGESPLGFRAPYGNIDEKIMTLLEESSIKYDSSIVSTFLRVEGGFLTLQAPRFMKVHTLPYHPSETNTCAEGDMEILEIPFSVLPITQIPIGFGYILLLGLDFYKFFMRFFNKELLVFYLHPYQLSRQKLSAGVPSFIRPYYGRLGNPSTLLEGFLEFLMTRFSPTFVRMDEIVQ